MIYFVSLVTLILVLISGILIRRLLQHRDRPSATERPSGTPEQTGEDVTPELVTSDTGAPVSRPADTRHSLWRTRYFRLTLVGLVVLIPVGAVSLYLLTGSPQHLNTSTRITVSPPQSDVEDLISRLVTHLENNPDNAEGWFILGRTYLKLGRYNAAVRALTTAHEQNAVATTKVALADALTLQNQGQVPDLAVTLLEQALSLAPDSSTALWMLGQAARQRDQISQARDYWQRALPLLQEQPEAQAALQTQLDTLVAGP